MSQALEEARVELGSVFGTSAENREIGITGDVQLVELDGPVVVVRLRGRFWHKRADVVSLQTQKSSYDWKLLSARADFLSNSFHPPAC